MINDNLLMPHYVAWYILFILYKPNPIYTVWFYEEALNKFICLCITEIAFSTARVYMHALVNYIHVCCQPKILSKIGTSHEKFLFVN